MAMEVLEVRKGSLAVTSFELVVTKLVLLVIRLDDFCGTENAVSVSDGVVPNSVLVIVTTGVV